MSFASFIPLRVRQVIYGVCALVSGLQLIWHFVPQEYDAKVTATLGLISGALALGNTKGN